MTWLEKLLVQHNELEAPMSFWFWCGLASISAVVKDNVWSNRQIHNIYPNIYVMLHAESGLKKGAPISLANKLVTEVGGTKVISGRSSIQGILKELGTAQTLPGGKVSVTSSAFICSSELTSSIVDDKAATDILTDLFDRQYRIGEWRSLLKMESFNIKKPTITMFTATNGAHATEFFAKKDINGGYIGRTFVILENKKNRINSLSAPLVNPPNLTDLIEYLRELSKLSGPFIPLGSTVEDDYFKFPYVQKDTGLINYYSEAGILYEEWYNEFYETIDAQKVKDDTGTLNRFGDSVLKVAMLLSLSRAPKLEIDSLSMQAAITYCEKLIGNVMEITHGTKGLSESKSLKAIIIKELLERETHQISHDMLLKKMLMHYKNAQELNDIMISFQDAKMIDIESIGNKIIYKMRPDQVLEYQKLFSGKNK